MMQVYFVALSWGFSASGNPSQLRLQWRLAATQGQRLAALARPQGPNDKNFGPKFEGQLLRTTILGPKNLGNFFVVAKTQGQRSTGCTGPAPGTLAALHQRLNFVNLQNFNPFFLKNSPKARCTCAVRK